MVALSNTDGVANSYLFIYAAGSRSDGVLLQSDDLQARLPTTARHWTAAHAPGPSTAHGSDGFDFSFTTI